MIKDYGGLALVQDPKEALFPRMPKSANDGLTIDAVLPIQALGRELVRNVEIAQEERSVAAMQPEPEVEQQRERVKQEISLWGSGAMSSSSSGFTCPLCGGAIWADREGPLQRYHCHTGHEFSEAGFNAKEAAQLETVLWQALRILRERAALLRSVSATPNSSGITRAREEAADLDEGAAILRRLLHGNAQPNELAADPF
jgi:two-component system chemotaxis response regulator CheB